MTNVSSQEIHSVPTQLEVTMTSPSRTSVDKRNGACEYTVILCLTSGWSHDVELPVGIDTVVCKGLMLRKMGAAGKGESASELYIHKSRKSKMYKI